MRILGLDFTSAPSRRKPITCAICSLDGTRLQLEEIRALPDFPAFEALLAAPGPWLGGFDFPFSLPRPVLEALGWPQDWAELMRHLEGLGKQEFEAALGAYKAARPYGAKEPPRATDKPARSRSPLKLFNPPVAKMLFQGAPRLLRSGASILPCHQADPQRLALETYPALAARALIGSRSYKNDDPRRQTAERREARRALLDALRSEALPLHYGVALAIPEALADGLLADGSGGRLDALLCAVQAAWCYPRRGEGYGIPKVADPLEGWIADPSLLSPDSLRRAGIS